MNDDKSRDERISSAIDGEASKEEMMAIAADTDLHAQAERWRANDASLRAAFDPIAESPIDEAMLSRLGLAEPHLPVAANDNPPWRRWLLPMGAVAAALVAMLTLGPLRSGPTDLDRALDATPSGEIAMVASAELQPILTVRARDGRWCREYAYRGNRDLACRDGGAWRLEARMRGTASQTGAVETAGGETGLDQAYAALAASDPLDRDEEQAAIAAGWRPAARSHVN